MTLTTHALAGAAMAAVFPAHPVLAATAAFASHLALDALPHWDYTILSKTEKDGDKLQHDMAFGKKFMFDLVRMGSDTLLGFSLSIFIFSFWLFALPVWLVVLGAGCGVLPDALQFVYFKTRSRLLLPLQRFHIWVQDGKSIYPHWVVGMGLQALIVGLLIALVYWV